MSALARLRDYGQSFWLDSLSRQMLDDGSLAARIRDQGLSGITSNPAIFAKAMAHADDYETGMREALDLRRDRIAGKDGVAPALAEEIYEALAVADVRDACDLLAPIYRDSKGEDGFVSLEVSPHLAYDYPGTLQQARALWTAVGRPNLLVKVPGTAAGLQAVELLLFEGIGVNITLLFGLEAYRETHQAYLRALERRLREGRDLHVSSVASFFLSRIDVATDKDLHQRMGDRVQESIRSEAASLLGRSAVANARLAYGEFCEVLQSERWHHLAAEGARPQRLVWASTGTKNPAYSDLMYVEPLIGPHTVSTMPEKTAAAFADHGRVAETLGPDSQDAEEIMERLGRLEIDFRALTERLVSEGVQKFIDPYDELIARVAERCKVLATSQAPGTDSIRRTHSGDSERPAQSGADAEALRGVANRLRAECIRMTTGAGSGHPTSCLSCADLVAALFFREMRWDPKAPGHRDMDRFLLSKGHAAPILWAALHEAGAIDTDPMTLRRIDSDLEGHPTPENPWVPVSTGSLGQGLSVANGMAVADRLDGIEARIFCLMGDGECSEGSVWEAAQFAADNRLARVVAIVDENGLAQSGPSPYGRDTSVLAGRFRAFGWQTLEIDGHDLAQILPALERTREGGPTAIVARTVKGKGVSFLEGAEGWHGHALDESERDRALAEIDAPASSDVRVEPRRVVAQSNPRHGGRSEPIRVEYSKGESVATRSAFGNALKELGARYPDLVVLDGDVKNSTKTELFAEAFPERFVEAQIAEQNMIGVALGLSASGKRPCAATFAAFLTRAYDFIRMGSHSRVPHLLICGSHAGVSIGQDGPSQMGLEDMAMFRALQGTTVLYPCDAVSAERLTEEALARGGIVYLRTTRGKTPVVYGPDESFPIGGSKVLAESLGDKLTLVAAGITVHTALEAHARLLKQGIATRVIDAYSVEPLDVATLERAARETGNLLVVEDHNRHGGLGEAVAAQIGRLGRVFRLGVSGEPHSGTPEELLERHRLSGSAIEQEALAIAA